MANLVLWRVVINDEVFHLVADDDRPGDYAMQLAKALGLKPTDKLPRPLDMHRVEGRIVGRVSK